MQTILFAALAGLAGMYFLGYYGAAAGILAFFILKTGFSFMKILVVLIGGYFLTNALLSSGLGADIMPIIMGFFLLAGIYFIHRALNKK